MIAIDDVLISEDVVEAQFVCNLNKCKGGCCEDGDAGAPLEKEEMKLLKNHYSSIKPFLSSEGIKVIEQQGKYVYSNEFGWVTPTVDNNICAFGYRDENGIIKCGIEAAYNEGKVPWKKPISCHLFPIKIKKTKEYTVVNYEPREDLCKAACVLGKKLRLPVYQFLKDALIRKFGVAFYNALHQVAIQYSQKKITGSGDGR